MQNPSFQLVAFLENLAREEEGMWLASRNRFYTQLYNQMTAFSQFNWLVDVIILSLPKSHIVRVQN